MVSTIIALCAVIAVLVGLLIVQSGWATALSALALGLALTAGYVYLALAETGAVGTYRTYRRCGHSIIGALRIAARHHLGKP